MDGAPRGARRRVICGHVTLRELRNQGAALDPRSDATKTRPPRLSYLPRSSLPDPSLSPSDTAYTAPAVPATRRIQGPRLVPRPQPWRPRPPPLPRRLPGPHICSPASRHPPRPRPRGTLHLLSRKRGREPYSAFLPMQNYPRYVDRLNHLRGAYRRRRVGGHTR